MKHMYFLVNKYFSYNIYFLHKLSFTGFNVKLNLASLQQTSVYDCHFQKKKKVQFILLSFFVYYRQ